MGILVFAGLVILIILSGFFSATETALTAFKRIKLKKVEEENPRAAHLLKIWIRKPNEILTAILLGNNIVNILASSIATIFIYNILGDKVSEGQAVFSVTLIMTIVILIFGEITPKIIAKTYSDKISQVVIKPMYYLSIVAFPLIYILTMISRILGNIFGVKISNEALIITEEDIKSMVNVGEEEGVLEEEEKKMIHSIFEFGDSTVKELMVPRVDMFAIEGSKSIDEVWDELLQMGFSRIPVYEEKVDNIIGIVYLKDLLPIIKAGRTSEMIKLFVREAYFIPETKLSFDLLAEFREKKIHIAVVVNEYGGTVGLTTIEDLLEEIVGEINDEFDEENEQIIKLNENQFRVDAATEIELLNRDLQLNLPEKEEYETLGGFIYYFLGKIAEKGESFEIENFHMKVEDVENHRIKGVIITKEKVENEKA